MSLAKPAFKQWCPDKLLGSVFGANFIACRGQPKFAKCDLWPTCCVLSNDLDFSGQTSPFHCLVLDEGL